MKPWLLLGGTLVLASCAAPAGVMAPSPPGAPEAGGWRQVLALPSLRTYRANWGALRDGAKPAEFVDVRADGYRYSWLYDGNWRISRLGGAPAFEVPSGLRNPREPLTFRRYNGTVFGPGGSLPAHYRILADASSQGGSTRFGGYGEVAIQAYYLNPTHYVEVLQNDQYLIIWEARNAQPGSGQGWRMLARASHPARLGQRVRFGAEIDTRSGQVLALLDGRQVASARSSLITSRPAAKFTIRATGNAERWFGLEVQELR